MGIPSPINPDDAPESVDQQAIDAWLERMRIAQEGVDQARAAVVGARERHDQERRRLQSEVERAALAVAAAGTARDESNARLTEAGQAVGDPKEKRDNAV